MGKKLKFAAAGGGGKGSGIGQAKDSMKQFGQDSRAISRPGPKGKRAVVQKGGKRVW